MATIYLVMRRGGEYDDAWKRVVCARFNKDAAERLVEATTARDQYLRDLDARTRAHMAAFVPVIPELPYPQLVPKKKWPAGLRKEDITQAMRDERAAIDAENAARMIPYRENEEARYLERTVEETRYLVEVEHLTPSEAEEKVNGRYSGPWYPPGDEVHNYVQEVECE